MYLLVLPLLPAFLSMTDPIFPDKGGWVVVVETTISGCQKPKCEEDEAALSRADGLDWSSTRSNVSNMDEADKSVFPFNGQSITLLIMSFQVAHPTWTK